MNQHNNGWPIKGTPDRIKFIEVNKIVEIADLGRHDPDVIKLWIGEGDLSTPDFICEAATKALMEGKTRYTYSHGLPELREALDRFYNRHWGLKISANRFSVTCGGVSAIMQAFQAILEPGDEVIIPVPAWPNVMEIVRIVGGNPVTVSFTTDQHSKFYLDLNQIIDAITPRTRAIYINTPCNPTGWIMPQDDMQKLINIIRERGLWLVSDEVYAQFTFDRPIATSFLELTEPSDRLIVTNTFSKNWCMSGWRIGWLVYPKGMGGVFDNLSQYNTTSVATFLQYGAIAALDEGDEFVRSFVKRCKSGRDIICSALEQSSGVSISRPSATMYTLFSVHGIKSSLELAKDILHKTNVGVAPGEAFGPNGSSFLRICFGSNENLLKTAAGRLKVYFDKLN